MKPPSTPKRFIAGAVCPRCNALDRLVVFKQQGEDVRQCVACGFEDVLRINPAKPELETRVNTPAEVKLAQTQVIKLPPSEKKC